MTREEIMRLEGRELDAAVHERVFGRPVKWVAPPAAAFTFPFDPDTRKRIPGYSTDIAAAWQVIERMWDLGWHVDMGDCEGAFECRFYRELPHPSGAECGVEMLTAENVAKAICLAALLAVCGEDREYADA